MGSLLVGLSKLLALGLVAGAGVSDPDLEPGFPVQAWHAAGDPGGQVYAVLVGEVDGDAELEILISGLALGPLYAWNHDASTVPGWPVAGVPGAANPASGALLVRGTPHAVVSRNSGNRRPTR